MSIEGILTRSSRLAYAQSSQLAVANCGFNISSRYTITSSATHVVLGMPSQTGNLSKRNVRKCPQTSSLVTYSAMTHQICMDSSLFQEFNLRTTALCKKPTRWNDCGRNPKQRWSAWRTSWPLSESAGPSSPGSQTTPLLTHAPTPGTCPHTGATMWFKTSLQDRGIDKSFIHSTVRYH